jgi:propanol-preferring alcohol dehydrogenase
VQYAKAMGLRVIAMDVGEEKLKFCLELGADFVVSAMAPDAAAQVVTITSGGSHGVCVFASQASAFKAAIDMCRRKVDP